MPQRGKRKSVRSSTAVSPLTRTMRRWRKNGKALCLFLLRYVKEVLVATAGAAAFAAATALAVVALRYYVAPQVLEQHLPQPPTVHIRTATEVTTYGAQP